MSETGWEISTRVAFVVSSSDRVMALNLDRPDQRPLALLGTAAAIWLQLTNADGERLVGGASERYVVSALARAFGQDDDVIAKDVQAFLLDMADRGYLVRR